MTFLVDAKYVYALYVFAEAVFAECAMYRFTIQRGDAVGNPLPTPNHAVIVVVVFSSLREWY